MKYNLSFSQRIELILIFPYWYFADKERRKTWHQVKKGLEKHTHNFTKKIVIRGFEFAQCDNDGCNLCIVVDNQKI